MSNDINNLIDWMEADAMASRIGMTIHNPESTSANISRGIDLYEGKTLMHSFNTIQDCLSFLKSLPQFNNNNQL